VTFLLLIPAFTILFVLIQLLQSTESIAVGLMWYGVLALLAAAALLYVYKYTFRLEGILEQAGKALRSRARSASTEPVEFDTYARSNEQSNLKAGRYGMILLVLGTFLSVGALSIVVNPLNWSGIESVFQLFILPEFWVRYAEFLAIALGATGVGILFFFLSSGGRIAGLTDEYVTLVHSVGIRLAVISLILLPLLILVSIALLPDVALSGLVFALTGLCFVALFLAAHFLYAYGQENRDRYLPYVFSALLAAFFFLFTKDQVAIHNATKLHAANLALVYDGDVEELKSRLGIAAKSLSGEDIYNGKCSACHLFDQKKIGPPYKEVVPKYEGNKTRLIAFVLNPVKVNPAYPSMPNQGLKPSEADSIVTFLLSTQSRIRHQPRLKSRRTEKCVRKIPHKAYLLSLAPGWSTFLLLQSLN
jgi:cytochrome c